MKKKKKNITIVGAGALGSHVVQFLRNEEATLKVIDFDRVEAKNILAQFHPRTGVGRLKTASLTGAMRMFWDVKIDGNHNRLTRDNRAELLAGSDLIIDCLDNAASRHQVQEFARGGLYPCLHGALAADGAFGRVIWDEHFLIDEEDAAGAPTCENGEHLPFIAIVSAYTARATQVYLRTGKMVGFSISPSGVIQV